jgi:citrate lyase beta subunit
MLDPSFADRLDAALAEDDALRLRRYPGAPAGRQPVHTVYVPAGTFGPDTAADWGVAALAALDEHGPLPGFDPAIGRLVRDKLASEPVEDLRIDFEDGYGTPTDEDEDADARSAARGVAAAVAAGRAPPFIGLRIKSLEQSGRRRALRTVDLFLATLLARAQLPGGFRITLPKVSSVRQVEVMAELCAALEREYGLDPLPIELQVETPQAVLGADGNALIAPMLHAAAGRCVGLHYGTYDYTAAVGIAAAYQSMEHPAADHAKAVMQTAAAQTGVVVSDGSTNVLPVGGRAAVHAAWELHARLVRRSLERGFYQGWDLHPAQLPTRYAATFAFYRDGFPVAAGRLRAYLDRVSSGILDEPATARALAGFLWRGAACGAVPDAELVRQAGLGQTDLVELMG